MKNPEMGLPRPYTTQKEARGSQNIADANIIRYGKSI
jgi:hypothetical protein